MFFAASRAFLMCSMTQAVHGRTAGMGLHRLQLIAFSIVAPVRIAALAAAIGAAAPGKYRISIVVEWAGQSPPENRMPNPGCHIHRDSLYNRPMAYPRPKGDRLREAADLAGLGNAILAGVVWGVPGIGKCRGLYVCQAGNQQAVSASGKAAGHRLSRQAVAAYSMPGAIAVSRPAAGRFRFCLDG